MFTRVDYRFRVSSIIVGEIVDVTFCSVLFPNFNIPVWITMLWNVQGVGLVVCGDDKGSLWLYNLPEMVKSNPQSLSKMVEPTTMLMWPELQVPCPLFLYRYTSCGLELKRNVSVFAFRNKNIAKKIIEILLRGCERGKCITWSHLFSQLVDIFVIIFATFRHILMRKAKVFAKIRKRKLVSTIMWLCRLEFSYAAAFEFGCHCSFQNRVTGSKY
jgi:hypothetical protein